MTKKLFNKWLKALKSRKYEQCQMTVSYDGKYCCLGVLSKVMKPDTDACYSVIHTVMSGKQLAKMVELNDDGSIDQYQRSINYLDGNSELFVYKKGE